ncbi:hypothetical protein D3C83_55660 [compost metagenome]
MSFSFATVMTPARTSMTWIRGISKVIPNARNIVMTKLRYASISGAGVMAWGAKLWIA